MGKRIDYFDMLRGVAIIFVLICHSYSGDPLNGSFKEELYLVVRQIVTCAVPIFLAESGFFLANKHFSNRIEFFNFWSMHSFRIWLPMVVWSIPLFFIREHENPILSIVYLLLGGYSIYYFITLIIQYYAMQPLFGRITRVGVILSLVLTALCLSIDNYYTSIQGHHISLFIEYAPFVMWMAYPAIGYYIGKNGRKYKVYPWLIIMTLGLVACVFETKWLYGYHENGIGATKISALIFSFSAIIVLFNEKTQKFFKSDSLWYSALVKVGEISFGIYLIHKYFLDFIIAPVINDTLLRALLTLLLSVAFILFFKKIFPDKFLQMFGFR